MCNNHTNTQTIEEPKTEAEPKLGRVPKFGDSFNLPATISMDGLYSIRDYIYDNVLPPNTSQIHARYWQSQFCGAIGQSVKTNEGKLFKRIRKYVYKNFGISLDSKQESDINAIIDENTCHQGVKLVFTKEYPYRLYRKFGDKGACFHGSHTHHRDTIDNECDMFWLLGYCDEEPIGRCWGEFSGKGLYLTNFYNLLDDMVADKLCETYGLYKLGDFSANNAGNNDGLAFGISPDIKSWSLNNTDCDGTVCCCCDEFVGEDYVRFNDNGEPHCESCYDETYSHCDQCENEVLNDDVCSNIDDITCCDDCVKAYVEENLKDLVNQYEDDVVDCIVDILK